MAANLRAEFTVHGVGQGLFYSGVIRDGERGRTLTFVYDCGVVDDYSKRPFLQARIDEYMKSRAVGERELTALFVSHLHEDHVSGLNSLLSVLSPSYVFLPYLSELDRATVAASNPEGEAWYYRLLTDPVAFLIDRGAGTVILVRRSPGRDQADRGHEDGTPRQDRPRETNNEAIHSLENDEELAGKIQSGEAKDNWSDHLRDGRLLVKTDRRSLAFPFWRFRFRSIEPDWVALADFHVEAKKCLESHSLNELLKNPEHRTRLRKLYNSLAKRSSSLHDDINNTSLVTFHGPYRGMKGKQSWMIASAGKRAFFSRLDTPFSFEPDGKPFGTLLTGDTNLRLADTYSDVLSHFGSIADEVYSIHAPHHGSRRSWNKSLIADFPSAEVFCVAAGVDSRFRHPSVDVIGDVIDSRRALLWSNQFTEIVHKVEGKT